MIDTRDRDTKALAWSGKINFRPRSGQPSATRALTSEVKLSYVTHPGYFLPEGYRNYGGNQEYARAVIALTENLKIARLELDAIHEDGTPNRCHKDWLIKSAYEWTLGEPLTLRKTVEDVKSLFLPDTVPPRFPGYFLYGYSCDGQCLNCVTFSLVLLVRLGVQVHAENALLRGYIESYLERTTWGKATLGAQITGTTLGVLGAAGVGAALGAPGGPPGMAVGAVVGLAVGAVVSIPAGFLGRHSLHLASNAAHAANLERAFGALYKKRGHNGLRVVRTRRDGAAGMGADNPFANQQLLDILMVHDKKNRSWFSREPEMQDFHPDCLFSDYTFFF